VNFEFSAECLIFSLERRPMAAGPDGTYKILFGKVWFAVQLLTVADFAQGARFHS